MPTHRDFVSLLPTRPRILDFGCGPGYEAMRLHASGADVVGIDISAKSIEIARMGNPACVFLEMDFPGIDHRVGSFDGVLAALVRDGSGSIKRHQVVDGHAMEWIAHRYTGEVLATYCAACDLRFIRNGALDEVLMNAGWRCCFYRADRP